MNNSDSLRIALPVGRLKDEALDFLIRCKVLDKSAINYDLRKLTYYDKENNITVLFIRNMDIPIYVEYGACDLGIVGKDLIMEVGADVYEFADLRFGLCRVCIAAVKGDGVSFKHDMKIATKYPKIAKEYFLKKGFAVETIKLYGSIEIAPIFGLCDLIVDLVSTGETLRKNGLEIVETIFSSSARMIGNKYLTRCKSSIVNKIMGAIE